MDKLRPDHLAKLQTLFISVDPNRDTVEQLRAYAPDFHPSINYLTGTKEQIAAMTKAYRVYFIKANEDESDEDDYLVDHSAVQYLVSPEGEFLDFFTSSVVSTEIAARISKHMDESEGVTSSSGSTLDEWTKWLRGALPGTAK